MREHFQQRIVIKQRGGGGKKSIRALLQHSRKACPAQEVFAICGVDYTGGGQVKSMRSDTETHTLTHTSKKHTLTTLYANTQPSRKDTNIGTFKGLVHFKC